MKTVLIIQVSLFCIMEFGCNSEIDKNITPQSNGNQTTKMASKKLNASRSNELNQIKEMQIETMMKIENIQSRIDDVMSELKSISSRLDVVDNRISSGRINVLAKNPKFSFEEKKAFLQKKLEANIKKRKALIDKLYSMPTSVTNQRIEGEKQQLEMCESMLYKLNPIDNETDFNKLTSKWFYQRWEEEMIRDWKNR